MIEAIETITDSEFETLGADWNSLLQASVADSFFLSWEWLHTWWKHLGGSRRLFLLQIRRGEELIAIAPLAKSTPFPSSCFRSGLLEFLGSGTAGSDYLDFIIRRGHEEDVLRALSQYLARENCVLELSQVKRSDCAAASLVQHCHQRGWRCWETKLNVCPSINLAGHTWDSYLGTLGSEHRYSFRRKLKALAARFEVRFDMACTEEERKEALSTLVSLHSMRWRERGGSDAFFLSEHVSFHDELSALALRRGWLRLFILRLDGRPVASLYGFRYGRVFYFYQSGFDPSFASFSIGLVVMGLAIKQAIEEGAEEYDMLHGAEAYKFHWTHQIRELGKIELYPPGTAGSAWKLVRSSSRSAKQVVRNVLPPTLVERIVALRKPKAGKDIYAPRPGKDGQFPCLTLDGR